MHKMIDSSPCIRGTQGLQFHDCSWSRFIPVHTGNTANKMAKRNGSPVHPRAYGEHITKP